MHYVNNTELSSLEETRCQFNGGPGAIKSAEGRIRTVCGLGIDVHQDFYVVVEQVDGNNPKPAQRFQKEAFLHWAAKLARSGAEVHAVYEACGFGFGLQRNLRALGIRCHVVCPQKLDEQNRRGKSDPAAAGPKRSALNWTVFFQANVMRWPLCVCPVKKKSKCAQSIGRG